MNRLNCTDLQATDEVIFPSSLPCNTNFLAYLLPLCFVTFLKISHTFGAIIDWLRRFGVSRKHTGRLPFVPSLMVLQSSFFIIFLVLTSLDVINARNGVGFVMYSLMYCVFTLYCFPLCRQFIKLGRRVIPLSKASMDFISPARDSDLSRENLILKIIMQLYVFVSTMQVLFGVIVLLADLSNYYIWVRVSCFFQWAHFVCLSSTFFFQFQRLIAAVKIGFEKPFRPEVVKAISKMRKTQLAGGVNSLICSIITLLIACAAIEFNFIVLLILLYFETLGCLSLFLLAKLKKRQHSSNNTNTTDEVKKTPAAAAAVAAVAVSDAPTPSSPGAHKNKSVTNFSSQTNH